MARLTNGVKRECRCGNCDQIEEWIENMGGDIENMCDGCPIQAAMNKLADFEDKEEENVALEA